MFCIYATMFLIHQYNSYMNVEGPNENRILKHIFLNSVTIFLKIFEIIKYQCLKKTQAHL